MSDSSSDGFPPTVSQIDVGRPEELPVTLIVPAFNAERWLERAIRSVFEDASSIPSEVVIVDDGSTDGTRALAERLRREFPVIRVVPIDVNGGLAAARLSGLRAAANEWVALLDSDDYLGVGAIPVAYLTAIRTDADICIWELHRDVNGDSKLHLDTRWLEGETISGRDACRLTLGRWGIHPLGLIRREVFLHAYEGFEAHTWNSDELVTRSLLQTARAVTSCAGRYFYVKNPHSLTQDPTRDRSGRTRGHLWIVRFAEENGYLFDDPKLASTLVRQGIILIDEVLDSGSAWPRPHDTSTNQGELIELHRSLSRLNPPVWARDGRRLRERARRLFDLRRQGRLLDGGRLA